MNELARLIVPALRHDAAHGFRYLDGLIDDALELGVGGFIVEGGSRDDVAILAARLHSQSPHPILLGARAERGAGETITGLTALPALGALSAASLRSGEGGVPSLDLEGPRRAARITARELRNIGANWAMAPWCDVDLPRDPAGSGVRAASDDAAVVGAIVAEWVDACQAESVAACAAAFPGADIRPFAAAIDSGLATMMIGSGPAGPRIPGRALTSPGLIANTLRGELQFDGIAATIPLDRDASIEPAHEPEIAVAALVAGCDLVLAPGDFSGTLNAMAKATRNDLTPARLRDARDRVERWAGWARPRPARETSLDDVMWSRQLADRAVTCLQGRRPRIGANVEVVLIDHSGGRGAAPADSVIAPFVDTLRALHISVAQSAAPSPTERAPLIIAFLPSGAATGDVPRAELDAVQLLARAATAAARDVAIVVFAHPRGAHPLANSRSGAAGVFVAWETSAPMQQAAARSLVASSRGSDA